MERSDLAVRSGRVRNARARIEESPESDGPAAARRPLGIGALLPDRPRALPPLRDPRGSSVRRKHSLVHISLPRHEDAPQRPYRRSLAAHRARRPFAGESLGRVVFPDPDRPQEMRRAGALLAVCNLLFFWPVLFHGRVFSSHDVVLSLHPWKAASGIDVPRNRLLADPAMSSETLLRNLRKFPKGFFWN